MKSKITDISFFTDGKGTSYYEPVIKSIRDFLENIDEINPSKGGAIVFFEKKNTEESDLMMQVFPFKTNIHILKDKETQLSDHQRLKIFEKINTKKPYKLFWHYQQFQASNGSDAHCKVHVPPDNIITYNLREITYKTVAPVTKKLSTNTTTWTEFYDNLKKGHIDKNTYEQLLFESGCSAVSFVPIPVLSTPSILLILNDRYLDSNKKTLLRSLYFRSRDTVDSYLYSRLLDALVPYLETYGEQWDEIDLVEAFVKEICNITLPISYKINDALEKEYYKHWPEGNNSTYVLPLLDGRYNVRFNLTSFFYIDLEQPTGSGCDSDWNWIHKSKLYESNCHQSSLLICKLFKLLHNNWKLIKSAEERAYVKVSKAINHIDIKSLKESVENIEKEFAEINKKKENQGIYTPVNELLIDDDKIFLTIDTEELITPADFDKRDVAKKSGFCYLKYILAESKINGNKFKVSVSNLFNNVQVPKKGKVNPDIENLKLDATKTLDEEANEICEILTGFYKQHATEIQRCLLDKKISEREDFNKGLYYILRILKEYNNNRTRKYFTPKVKVGSLTFLNELQALYTKVNKELTEDEMKKCDVSVLFKGLKAAKITKEKDENGIDQKQFVRECFQALIKLLRNKKNKLTGAKKAAMERLLLNLEVSGLIKENGSEPASQANYSYDQSNKKAFIDWRF